MSVNTKRGSVVAWILLPIFVIVFFILGGFLGIAYQKRKDGWNVGPEGKVSKEAKGVESTQREIETGGR